MRTELMDLEVQDLMAVDSRVMLCDDLCAIGGCCCCCTCCCSTCDGDCWPMADLA